MLGRLLNTCQSSIVRLAYEVQRHRVAGTLEDDPIVGDMGFVWFPAVVDHARLAVRKGAAAAEERLQPELVRLVASEDAAIGIRAFLAREQAEFVGR